MTQATGSSQPSRSPTEMVGGFFRDTEINPRILGMLVALVVALIGFHIWSDFNFLQPANIGTLAVQTSGIAIVATGMVLIIVSRNIDLSVGSQIGVTTMLYAMLMTQWLPNILGIQLNDPMMWVVALAIGITVGAIIGGFQGFLVAYVGVPSFVVTLAGLLAIRGIVWNMSQGEGVFGIDETFRMLGGGYRGSVGGDTTWILGILACIGIIAFLFYSRRQRKKYGFKLRPLWAEIALGAIGVGTVMLLAWFMNQAFWPKGAAEQFAVRNEIPIPEGGLQISIGFPWPVLLLIVVTIVMTFIATRLRFGRYVYSYGGNPEAAKLAGINTRWVVMMTFVIIGILCAFSGAIASARLSGATLDIGTTRELDIIAATVVGGASFTQPGVGTVPGAVLGALFMTTLRYGLQFNGIPVANQNIVIAAVLIIAVGLDQWNRRRAGDA